MKKILLLALPITLCASGAFGAASLKIHNDLNTSIQFVRIESKAFEIKGNRLITSNPGVLKAGTTHSFDIVHVPDEDQPLGREEKDLIKEIWFDQEDKTTKTWHTYSCVLNEPFDPHSGKDIEIKASRCKLIKSNPASAGNTAQGK